MCYFTEAASAAQEDIQEKDEDELLSESEKFPEQG